MDEEDKTRQIVNEGNSHALPAGTRLREFLVEGVLGEGGFGIVYRARDLRLQRAVAVKEYMPGSLAARVGQNVEVRSAKHRETFATGLRSFIEEAVLLARFEHPALVKVHQFWEEHGTAYMVMPLHDAPSLREWIRLHPAPDEAWVRRFFAPLVEAVGELHGQSVLHRDIAPDNILVLKDQAPLLLDLGAARQVIGDLTQNLTVILKPGYAPIEQYANDPSLRQGPWTDVYALSAVLYFVVAGRAPPPSVSRILTDQINPARVRGAGRFSLAFLDAIDRGLAVRPDQRPTTVAGLQRHWEAEDPIVLPEGATVARKPVGPGSIGGAAAGLAGRGARTSPPSASPAARPATRSPLTVPADDRAGDTRTVRWIAPGDLTAAAPAPAPFGQASFGGANGAARLGGPEPSTPARRWVPIGIGALGLVAILGAWGVWSGGGAGRTGSALPPTGTDGTSQPAAAPPSDATAPAAAPAPAASRASAPAAAPLPTAARSPASAAAPSPTEIRSTTPVTPAAAPVPPSPDAAPAPIGHADPVPVPAVVAAPAPRDARSDATVAKARPSAPAGPPARCLDILQRAQIGEPLSEADTAFLRRACH